MKLVIMFFLLCLACLPNSSQAQYGNLYLVPQDVLRVYDGDTFFVTITYLPDIIGENISIRVGGIDTPELRSACVTQEEKYQERALAEEARQLLEDQLMSSKIITLTNLSRDKFFRINATVLADGVDVGVRLLASGLAIPYNGKTSGPNWCGLSYQKAK